MSAGNLPLCIQEPYNKDCLCTDISQTKLEVKDYATLEPYCEVTNMSMFSKNLPNYFCCGTINTMEGFNQYAFKEVCEDLGGWTSNVRSDALLQFWTSSVNSWKSVIDSNINHARIELRDGVLRGACHEGEGNTGVRTGWHYHDSQKGNQNIQRRLYYANVYGAIGLFCDTSTIRLADYVISDLTVA